MLGERYIDQRIPQELPLPTDISPGFKESIQPILDFFEFVMNYKERHP